MMLDQVKRLTGSSSEDISVLNINNASVKIPNGIWFFKTVNIISSLV